MKRIPRTLNTHEATFFLVVVSFFFFGLCSSFDIEFWWKLQSRVWGRMVGLINAHFNNNDHSFYEIIITFVHKISQLKIDVSYIV
jgi:hypothetical protein